ncbi:DNA polymerase/3'-5' exonuclease PolX [Halorubellus sp. PRR65]|uniref:DNA polymerase/3'-5' exonuclease PolX n=1 Tax=Halorubellus sp. PRR65 TaxID=3098148 RepID=UPI002B25D46F|nr:DNA polymerase/3'-5' exonuclease PolX [Halorubellus sp. PRR65]
MALKHDVGDELEAYANLLEMDGVEYKPNVYRRAVESLREYPGSLEALAEDGEDALQALDDVGDAISSKIVEYHETGAIEEVEALRERYPVDLDALLRVEGVGPKTIGTLYDELGVTDLDELEAAAEDGRVQDVKGFGAKTEANILDAIPFARQAGERELLGEARPVAERVRAFVSEHDAVEAAEVAGSTRRWRATIGDVDVLAASADGQAVVDAFAAWEPADAVIEAGEQKASLRLDGMRIDLRVVVPEEFGSALQYFTGSKDHNVTLRNYAIERSVKLNEYGAFDVSEVDDAEDGQRVGERIGGDTEASMYAALDLPLVPPELREGRGEVRAAIDDDLPTLVAAADVRGDLHTHTDASDGANSVREMVEAAKAFGHEYVAITDHATGPGVVGGMGVPDDDLLDLAETVAAVDDDVNGVTAFSGVEANVAADGSVSVADDVLDALDVVVASPHSALDQPGDEATDRLCTAMEHPAVDVLGHPTGRLLNQREGLGVDANRLAAVAADEGVALEVNATPSRLDLSGSAVQAAVDAGATVSINTDSHRPGTYGNVTYGVHTARRGWAEPDDVLNTYDERALREFLH